ncbi:hypothetical protein EVA_20922 [gut metagenome]|uniref:Uncharacterized protein n=1 Tax=gut metagenome TaxID=749906 RepID=J9F957_9ZZZZ
MIINSDKNLLSAERIFFILVRISLVEYYIIFLKFPTPF